MEGADRRLPTSFAHGGSRGGRMRGPGEDHNSCNRHTVSAPASANVSVNVSNSEVVMEGDFLSLTIPVHCVSVPQGPSLSSKFFS